MMIHFQTKKDFSYRDLFIISKNLYAFDLSVIRINYTINPLSFILRMMSLDILSDKRKIEWEKRLQNQIAKFSPSILSINEDIIIQEYNLSTEINKILPKLDSILTKVKSSSIDDEIYTECNDIFSSIENIVEFLDSVFSVKSNDLHKLYATGFSHHSCDPMDDFKSCPQKGFIINAIASIRSLTDVLNTLVYEVLNELSRKEN